MRKYRRRRSPFQLKLKNETVYTLFSIFLFALSGTFVLSFAHQGPILEKIFLLGDKYFGWGVYLVPLILVFLGFLFTRLRMTLAKPNISAGAILFWLALLGLTRAGKLGEEIWVNTEVILQPVGE